MSAPSLSLNTRRVTGPATREQKGIELLARLVAFPGADHGQGRACDAAQGIDRIEYFRRSIHCAKLVTPKRRQDALNDSFCACGISLSGMLSTSFRSTALAFLQV